MSGISLYALHFADPRIVAKITKMGTKLDVLAPRGLGKEEEEHDVTWKPFAAAPRVISPVR
jgi:hypothetical protein